MKKIYAFLLLSILISGTALASEKVGPDAERAAHRAEMKAIKAKMKAEGKKPLWNSNGFWKREGERSGLNQWKAENFGQAVSNLNPVPFFKEQKKRYQERKAASN